MPGAASADLNRCSVFVWWAEFVWRRRAKTNDSSPHPRLPQARRQAPRIPAPDARATHARHDGNARPGDAGAAICAAEVMPDEKKREPRPCALFSAKYSNLQRIADGIRLGDNSRRCDNGGTRWQFYRIRGRSRNKLFCIVPIKLIDFIDERIEFYKILISCKKQNL